MDKQMMIQTKIHACDYMTIIDEHMDEAREHLKLGEYQSFIDKVDHIAWHLQDLKTACAEQHGLMPTKPLK